MYPYYGQPPAPDDRYNRWPQYPRPVAAAPGAGYQQPWPQHGYYSAPSDSTGTAYGPHSPYQAPFAPRSTPAPPPAAPPAAGHPYTGPTYEYHSAPRNSSRAGYGPQYPYQAHLAPRPTPVQAVTQPYYDPRALPNGHQPYVPPLPRPSGSFHGYPQAPFHQSSGGYRHSNDSANPHGVVSTHVGNSGQHAPPSNTNEQHLQPGGLAPTSNERVIDDGQIPSDWFRLDDGPAQDAFERLNDQQALGSLSRQHDGGFPPRQLVGGSPSHQQVGGSPARRQVDGSTAREQVNQTSPSQHITLGAPVRSEDNSPGTYNAEQSVESRSSTTSAPVEQALVAHQNAVNITPRGLQQYIEDGNTSIAALVLQARNTDMESEHLHRYIEDATAGNAALKLQADEKDLESEQLQGRLEASHSRRRALVGQVIASDARNGRTTQVLARAE